MNLSDKQITSLSTRILFRWKQLWQQVPLATGILVLLNLLYGNAYAVDISPAQWAVLKKGNIITRVGPGTGAGTEQGVAIGIVNAPLATVWKVIHENNDFKYFMPGMLESILIDPAVIDQAKSMDSGRHSGDPRDLIQFLRKHRIDKMTGSTGYFFALLNVPWSPVHKWYVVKLEDFITGDEWFQHWNILMGDVKTNNGSWDLVPLEGNKTLVTYTLYADADGLLPDMAGDGTTKAPAKEEAVAGNPTIVVANGCASGNNADFYADKIKSEGFRILRVGEAQTLNYESSEVIFDEAYYRKALDILGLIPGKQKLLKLKVKQSEYDIYVVIGCSATDQTMTGIIEGLRHRVQTEKGGGENTPYEPE